MERFRNAQPINKKTNGLYEVESVDNPNICTISINPKEYLGILKDRNINKKHKGVRRDAPGMNFESYAGRIAPLRPIDSKKPQEKKLVQKRLQVKNTNMIMSSINKVQFASLNDKRYYFSNGIVSLPYGHPLLTEVRNYKKSPAKVHTVIEREKDKLLQLENRVVARNERLRILRSIFAQPITYYKLNSKTRLSTNNFIWTCNYILDSMWL